MPPSHSKGISTISEHAIPSLRVTCSATKPVQGHKYYSEHAISSLRVTCGATKSLQGHKYNGEHVPV